MFPVINDVPESYCELEKFFRFTHQVSHELYEIVKHRHTGYEFPSSFEEQAAQRRQAASKPQIANALTLLDAAADLRDLYLRYEQLHADPEQERLSFQFREFESNPGKFHLEAGEAHVLREFDSQCLRQFVAPVPVFVALRKQVPAYAAGASAAVLQPWIEEYRAQTMSLPDTGHGWYREIYAWLHALREVLPQLKKEDPASRRAGLRESVRLLNEVLLFDEVLEANFGRSLWAVREYLKRWSASMGIPPAPAPQRKFEGEDYREIATRYAWSMFAID